MAPLSSSSRGAPVQTTEAMRWRPAGSAADGHDAIDHDGRRGFIELTDEDCRLLAKAGLRLERDTTAKDVYCFTMVPSYDGSAVRVLRLLREMCDRVRYMEEIQQQAQADVIAMLDAAKHAADGQQAPVTKSHPTPVFIDTEAPREAFSELLPARSEFLSPDREQLAPSVAPMLSPRGLMISKAKAQAHKPAKKPALTKPRKHKPRTTKKKQRPPVDLSTLQFRDDSNAGNELVLADLQEAFEPLWGALQTTSSSFRHVWDEVRALSSSLVLVKPTDVPLQVIVRPASVITKEKPSYPTELLYHSSGDDDDVFADSDSQVITRARRRQSQARRLSAPWALWSH